MLHESMNEKTKSHEIIHQLATKSSMGALYGFFILVESCQWCKPPAPELGWELGKNDCKSSVLAIRLTGQALSGLSNFIT